MQTITPPPQVNHTQLVRLWHSYGDISNAMNFKKQLKQLSKVMGRGGGHSMHTKVIYMYTYALTMANQGLSPKILNMG